MFGIAFLGGEMVREPAPRHGGLRRGICNNS